jgi:putative ATP-dependent endonuclease of the OLD family
LQVKRLSIENFRGVATGTVHFTGHTLLVGGNNLGKSTVCEALDLVLGPERLYRRPVVDEHDFHCGKYLTADKQPVQIRIQAVLTELPEEAQLRFFRHLRRWNETKRDFVDEDAAKPSDADAVGTSWALPVVFLARYDRDEDDFVGNTFFDHPVTESQEDEAEEIALGAGRQLFGREHKRLCGFVFLRTLRTGARALSLQRGSLLDTVLRLGGTGLADMWQDTLERLQALSPAVGDVAQLKQVRQELRDRMGRFVSLSPGDDSTTFFASDLTREHLREVVRLFIAAEPIGYSIPFARLGTGSVNLLVFALLTVIADLKQKRSVIFAMEEPEIALPPHTQRRVSHFVLSEMGQAIVTSHSPYVIEQFEPQNIVILDRDGSGLLQGRPIDLTGFKPKMFKTERRQFAEAILSRAVLVVEGSTELALFPAASTVMEDALGPEAYRHFDMAGISVFNAGGDGTVPRYGPVFKALAKPVFGFFDKPNKALGEEAKNKLASFDQCWESPEKGIENLLVNETSSAIHHRFLLEVCGREDYPQSCGPYFPAIPDDPARELARAVLKERKGDAYGYAAIFVRQCQAADELPKTVREILIALHDATNEMQSSGAAGPVSLF